MVTSPQRKCAMAIIDAFNRMDIAAILSYRSSDCLRYYLPTSMGYPPQANDSYETSLRQLKAIFTDFRLMVDDVVEDKDARTICVWLKAKGNTAAGLYENDYVWLWEFDETGTKIVRSKEFSDSIQNKVFWPKLQAAMKQQQEQQGEQGNEDQDKEDEVVKVQS